MRKRRLRRWLPVNGNNLRDLRFQIKLISQTLLKLHYSERQNLRYPPAADKFCGNPNTCVSKTVQRKEFSGSHALFRLLQRTAFIHRVMLKEQYIILPDRIPVKSSFLF